EQYIKNNRLRPSEIGRESQFPAIHPIWKILPTWQSPENRLRVRPGFAPSPQQPLKAEGLNGAVIHRKRCSAPKGTQTPSPWNPPFTAGRCPAKGLPAPRTLAKGRAALGTSRQGYHPRHPAMRGRAALQIPAQGVLPLDAAIHSLPDLPPSIDRFCGNGT